MEYSNLLAVISLTHNHPETIEDVLEHCAEYYKRAGVEIYFFDSSDDDQTKDIIEDYRSRGYDNLIHVPLRGNTVEDKLDMVYSGRGLNKVYKYVWPTKDRALVSERVLKEVIEAAKNEYDIIYTDNPVDGKAEYTDPAEFYRDYAAFVTSINLTVYNTTTILKNNTFTEDERYIDIRKNAYSFPQIVVTFEGLADIPEPRIRIVDIYDTGIYMSAKSSTISPHSLVSWKDHWIYVNDSLSEIYDNYKGKVIKEAASLPWILGEVSVLLELKEQGVITQDNLSWVLEGWERISDIPKSVVIAIAKGEYDQCHDLNIIKTDDKLIKLLTRVSNLIKDSDERVDISFDSTMSYIIDMINASKKFDINAKAIIAGSVKDCVEEAQDSLENREKLAECLQRLIVFILLLKE